MKKLFSFFIGAVGLSVALVGCRKKENHHPSPRATITITKPSAGQLFRAGDTVVVEAEIRSETTLHGYKLAITNSRGDTVFAADDHAHAAVLNINRYWVNTHKTPDDLNVTINTEIDHDGNTVSKEVMIRVEP